MNKAILFGTGFIVCCVIVVIVWLIPTNVTTEAEMNLVFFHKCIPELQLDYEAIERESTQSMEETAKKEIERLKLIAEQQERLDETPEMNSVAIVIGSEKLTKRDIKRLELSTEALSRNYITDLKTIFKSEIISKVRQIIVKQMIEKECNPLSDEEIEEITIMQKANAEKYKAENEVYIAAQGMTVEEYCEYLINEAIYLKQKQIWEGNLVAKNKTKIKREALRKGITETEYAVRYFFPKYIDELVSKAEIEVLDPELKALFGIAE